MSDDRQVILVVYDQSTRIPFPLAEPWTNDGRYISYFVNEHGDQLLFVYDYETGEAVVISGGADWIAYPVTEPEYREGRLTPPAPDTNLALCASESFWLMSCWMATRPAYEARPVDDLENNE